MAAAVGRARSVEGGRPHSRRARDVRPTDRPSGSSIERPASVVLDDPRRRHSEATKASLALFEHAARGAIGERLMPEIFLAADFESPEAPSQSIGAATRRVTCASFGVAGPPVHGRVSGRISPGPWRRRSPREEPRRRRLLPERPRSVRVRGPRPRTGRSRPIQRARPIGGNAAMIAAGTGLGETTLARVGGELVPVASEGGHGDFAARTERGDRALSRAAAAIRPRAAMKPSCPAGLARVAEWTHGRTLERPAPVAGGAKAWTEHLAEAAGEHELPLGISRNRDTRGDMPLVCARTRDFVSVLGRGGNLALRCVARGRNLSRAASPRRSSPPSTGHVPDVVHDKEPHRDLLRAIPVWVVRNEHSAFPGAAGTLPTGRRIV
jgi:glucokinase